MGFRQHFLKGVLGLNWFSLPKSKLNMPLEMVTLTLDHLFYFNLTLQNKQTSDLMIGL